MRQVGNQYPPHYANRLYNAVERRLHHPHRFVCLTENSAGLDERIEILPLPPGLTGYWNKISLFKAGTFHG